MADPRYGVFLSHNSKDKPAVERIAKKLRQNRIEPWLDVWCLPAGKSFQAGIELGLKTARGCAYFVGGHGPGQWQMAELEAAQDLAVKNPDFQLFSVLLPGAPDPFDGSTLPIFLAARTWVDLRGGFEDPHRFQRLINAVFGLPMEPPALAALDEGDSPYRGLQVFDEAHADFFFGRENDIQRLIEKLKASRFLAVVGPSGSGKSSLVRAGLLPALRNGLLPGSHGWPVRVFTPGARPLDTLAAELARADPERSMGRTLDELRERPQTLDQAATMLLAGESNTARIVLVVDQFEEIFTLCTDDEQRAKFLDNLLYAATVQDGRCIVIITLRADFYPRCAAYPELATLLAAHQVLLGPLDEQGLRAVIEQPARRVGVGFEEGLVDRILNDVGQEAGALPLLQHALLELWRRNQGMMLRLAAYEESGGVARALATRADAIYDSLEADEQEVARRVLLRLTQPGEETEDTRRRAELSELVTRPSEQKTVQDVVNGLVGARLLTADQQAADGAVHVDVAHEALIRAWPRLRTWLDEDREGLRTHRRLTEAAQEWERNRRDPDLLYRGVRLAEAQALAARAPNLLNQQETAFLAESVALRERELALERQRQEEQERQRKRVIAGLAVFSLVALILAGVAVWQGTLAGASAERADDERAMAVVAQQAAIAESTRAAAAQQTAEAQSTVAAFEAANAIESESTAVAEATRAAAEQQRAEEQANVAATAQAEALHQARVAHSRQLAAQAGTVRRPDLGLLLSLEALRLDPGSVEARGSLVDRLSAAPGGLRAVLRGHSGPVPSVAFSPSNRTVVSGGSDGTVRIWDVISGDPIGDPLAGHPGGVRGVAFGPDGMIVASTSPDGSIILWENLTDTPTSRALPGQAAGLFNVAFSPDGERVAAAAGDGTIALWDVATGTSTGELQSEHTDLVADLAFSLDGEVLASAGLDGNVVLWDLTSGTPERSRMLAHDLAVLGVAFSPDGTLLASSDDDGNIRVWNLASDEQEPVLLEGHVGTAWDVAFSPDGTTLASAGADGTVRQWDVATGTTVGVPWRGHEGTVWGVAFSPDGEYIASSGDDGMVVIRGFRAKPLISRTVATGLPGIVWDLTLSPDGSTVVASDQSGTVRFWDSETGAPVGEPLLVPGGVTSIDFSPDGQLLATAGGRQVIWLWDAVTREGIGQLRAPAAIVDVAISQDGRMLAAAGQDGSITLLDLLTGEPRGTLEGHTSTVCPSSVAISPNGLQLASASADRTIRLWDLQTQRPLYTPFQMPATVLKVAFDPSGQVLATAVEDGTVMLWDIASFRLIGRPWRGHDGVVYALAFSPDGAYLASAGKDRTVVLWDIATWEQIGEPWRGHTGEAWTVAFSPDGTRLVSAGTDGTVMMWDVSLASWMERACAIVHGNLDEIDWQRYLGDAPYQKTCPSEDGPQLNQSASSAIVHSGTGRPPPMSAL